MATKMLVIGGTGMSGIAVLYRATKNDDIKVTAFVRTASKVPQELQSKVEIVVGDILNVEDVDNVMKDQDVVVSCLGKRLLDKGDATVYSKGMEIIIESMRKNSVKYLHFVGISSFLPGSMNMPQWMHPTVRESHKMYAYIKSVEDITWVATMAPNISDSAYTGNYKVEIDKLPGGMNVTKEDLADWLVTSTIDNSKMEEYNHKMLGISSMGTSFCVIS